MTVFDGDQMGIDVVEEEEEDGERATNGLDDVARSSLSICYQPFNRYRIPTVNQTRAP